MPRPLQVEACILAGGLSSRMGRDKSRLRLVGKTLLAHVRTAALQAGLPVRVIRKDRVPRCGPLGGIYTGLCTSTAQTVLFLACDMPFINRRLLERLVKAGQPGVELVSLADRGRVGFPLLLRRDTLPKVEEQLAQEHYSLQELAARLKTRRLSPGRSPSHCAWNVNTPEELAEARSRAEVRASPSATLRDESRRSARRPPGSTRRRE